MYLEHLQNWLVHGHSLLIFLIFALFWLSETGQIWGFRAFPGDRMEEMAWNFARWCMHLQNWLVYGHSLFIFIILVLFLLSETGQIRGFRAFPGEFCMLMYLDHLQNWFGLGHGLLTFVILPLFWLSETGQIWGFRAFPGERMEGMAWNMVCCCILTTSRTDSIMVTVWWFF